MTNTDTFATTVAPHRPKYGRTLLNLGVAMLAIFAVLAIVGTVRLALFLFSPRSTLVSQSPDRSHRIVVHETRWRFVDRNFRVRVVDQRTDTGQEIYKSGDQSPAIKKERFVWSEDGSKVVLVGDRYFVVPGSTLASGEHVFLMYDVETGELWCNADRDRVHPNISAQEVEAIFGDRLAAQ